MPTSLIRCFFNWISITAEKTVVQDISTFFATVRGILASKVMFTFYREALISFVSVTTEICWNAPTMGFWYLAQNISANVFWCFWQLFALEICGLDARMSTGCHSKITVSPKIEPTPHAKARDQARVKHRRARNTKYKAQKSGKYEIRSTEEREIRWCAVEGLLQHISKLDRWKYYHLVAIPTWRGGPPWSHHSFGERFFLENSQMAHGEPHFS